ncbi:LOW QUALITY PROTEIN: hypothetical protein ACHAWT_000876 [Skeletonema menzelii]
MQGTHAGMSSSSLLSQESSGVGESCVADNNNNPTSTKNNNGEDVSVDDLASLQQLSNSKSVRFSSSGKVRWFVKKESIIDANFQDEEHPIDFAEERRKVLKKQVVKSERSVPVMPFSMSLLDDGAFAAKENRNSRHEYAMKQPDMTRHTTAKKQIQVVLLQSQQYTQILYQTMKHIHQDRDLLLEALLKWCGFFHGAKTIDDRGGNNVSKRGALAAFLTILPPKLGTRALLELFHDGDYLDLLEFPTSLDGSREIENKVADAVEGNDKHTALQRDISSTNENELRKGDTSNDALLQKLLAEHGLEDDCPLPADDYSRALLWKYCLSVAGASWHAASLLVEPENDHHADVVVNWGGGRHHAHANKAGGFCYVNDIVLAIKRLLQSESVHEAGSPAPPRVLYIDIDIHHCDGVQQAFYSTDLVMTASFHRNSPGFFPATSGFVREKGEAEGLGYNLNVPLPTGIDDFTFIRMYRKMLFGLVNSFDPDYIVLCVGADGLEGDALVTGKLHSTDHSSTGEGWSLSPEGLAECVRITSSLCAGLKEEMICTRPMKEEKKENQAVGNASDCCNLDTKATNDARESVQLGKRRKLLVLGGGGYTPTKTARANLLVLQPPVRVLEAAYFELPKDIPSHDYFPRYGPLFELVSEETKQAIWNSYDIQDSAVNASDNVIKESTSPFFDDQALQQGTHAIELACLFIDRQRKKAAHSSMPYNSYNDRDDDIFISVKDSRRKKKASQGGRRRKKKKEV